MRLLIVSYEYPPIGGGGGVMVRTLARELAKHVNVTVLTTRRVGLSVTDNDGGVEVVRVPVWGRHDDAIASLSSLVTFCPSSLWRGSRLASRPFDVVHSSFAVPSGPTGVFLARRWGVPHILTVHGGDIFDPSRRISPHRVPILRNVVRGVIRRSDRIVALSSEIERRTREIYGAAQVTKIPPGVQEPAPAETTQADHGLVPGEVILVTASRLVVRKGIDALIDVLHQLRNLQLQLVIIGSGPLRGTLEAQANTLGLNGRIRFTGHVSDEEKWRLFQAADIYVSTTHHEGFGIAFLEAMRAGLPVVAYDSGGQRDLLRPGESVLVPHDDRDEFARCLARVATATEERQRLSAAARSRAREYTVARFATSYLDLYRQCASAAP